MTSSQIKIKAREIGFDLCGVAPAASFPELSVLREWLDRGYAGRMTYLNRSAARRADVRAVVPTAQSVVVTGTLYNTDRPYSTQHAPSSGALVPEHRGTGEAPAARIARYAWGDDYHDVLKTRLDALVAWMREQADEPFEARAYVDTGPVQERVYAQYAGLGWIGKNTCLINEELGSWLFLAELITTLPLEPDPQGLERCGSCTRCLEACPTDALVEPGTLDATQCLSYLTIELRGAIPEAMRPALGAHVFGCDICQEVCPFNQAPVHSPDQAWQPRGGLDAPRLVDLWRRSDDELATLLKGGPMTRAGVTGLRRNLAVAMGNSGDAEAAGALTDTHEGQPSTRNEMVREHIDWALNRVSRM